MGEKTTPQTVRNAQRVSDSPHPIREKALAAREDVVLYQDEQLIRLMCTKLITASDRKPSSIARVLDRIQAILGQPGISLGDFDEDSITEFAIRPVLKFTTGVEAGVEFEIKWDMSNELNITKAVRVLFWKLPALSASQLLHSAEKQNATTPPASLIYVGKPVCVYGLMDSNSKECPDGFYLIDGIYSVNVRLKQDSDKLLSQSYFLRDRRLYVVGLVESVNPLKICAGAILLSNRALLSIERVI
ncbi:MAG: hypothetical protein QXT77_09580 [Candidatus Methanomethylicaceae archaeon]